MIPERKMPQFCMPGSIPIHGTCDSCFSKVRELFQRSFDSGEEIGAAVCFVLEGKCVIDLWGPPHHHDLACTREWESRTLVIVYSTTNGMTAICANQLLERAGKEKITIRHLLSREARLCEARTPLPKDSLCDWDRVCAALAVLDFW